MKISHMTVSAGLLLILASATQGQNILYQYDFSGAAATPLHQLTPDVNNNGGGTKWITRTDTGLLGGVGREYYADGHIDTTLDLNVNGSASLGFAPLAGNVYTLTVRVSSIFNTGTGAPFSWLGIGFSAGYATGAGGGAEFFGNGNPDQVLGQPWMMHRTDTSVHPDQRFLGPGVTGGGSWSTAVVAGGDPVDMRIVLNTTPANWTVEWLAKAPAAPTYTSVGTAAFTTNPTIRAITIANNFEIGGTIDSITLTTSGDTYAAGDTNGDGVADVADFDTMRNNFFNPVFGPTFGDFTNNGLVDYADFRIWKGAATLETLRAVGIPEPSCIVLVVTGLFCASRRRR
jgi:hypothetical protein